MHKLTEHVLGRVQCLYTLSYHWASEVMDVMLFVQGLNCKDGWVMMVMRTDILYDQ